MKIKYLWAVLLICIFWGCDDNTANLGLDTLPDSDNIPVGSQTYDVSTSSLLSDSVYARTNTGYLGKYTDPNFGIFEADFLAQFNKNTVDFPETLQGDTATSVELRLFYSTYFGDSLNTCRLRVDSLDKVLEEGDIKNYYTSLNPADYYNENAKPLAYKAYTAVDLTINDSIRYSDNYSPNVRVKLPTSLGTYIIRKYKENKSYFQNSEEFIRNVFKGIYVRCEHGDGTILYIDEIAMFVNFKYLAVRPSTGVTDSLVTGAVRFTATQEVIQANHFQNRGKLTELVKEDNNTYLKTPAGIFTEATLPINEIMETRARDTLNSVQITFTNYNNPSTGKFKMGIPKKVIMLRKKDMYSFFEKNQLADNITSFLVSLNTSNEYEFSNIARLITICIRERKEGEKTDPDWTNKNPDWNKVVIIPVKVIEDSKSEIISIRHDLELSSARLKGGSRKGNELPLKVRYTTFN